MKRIGSMVLLLVLLLTGCGGVSKEEYEAVCAQRDALREELEREQEPDTVSVTIRGGFTATVRDLIPDYVLDDKSPRMAVVTLFQSSPFALYVGDLGEQMKAGETYVFEIEAGESVEISEEEYAFGSPDPEIDIARYNLQVSGFRPAEEGEYGLESNGLVYERPDLTKGEETADE